MRRLLLFLFLCSVISAGPWAERRKRQAVLDKNSLWPNAKILYSINFAFSGSELSNIQKAMREWSALTCAKFQAVPSNSPVHHAKILRDRTGCFSSTGYDLTDQIINLDATCMDPDIVLHELGHTLGLLHEQERTDRDRFVRIDPRTIQEKYRDQFQISPSQTSHGLPYSYRSIMHYGKDFFNRKGFVAIQALDKKFYDIIGNAEHLSFRDAWLVNIMYKCDNHCRLRPACPVKAFVGKDCRCWCPHDDYTAVDCVTRRAIDPLRVRHETGRLMRNPKSGTLLYWSEHEFDWFTARDRCQKMGGSLIDFKDPKKLFDVETNIGLLVKENYDPPNKYKSQFIWIGGSDINSEGRFQWLDGSPVNLRGLNMGRGEPNNGGGLNEDCLAIFPQYGSTFSDWDCGKKLRYICDLKSECHDLSPTCAYFREIGSCKQPKIAASCRRTCGQCSPSKKPPNVRPPNVRPPNVRPPNVRPPNVRPPNVRPPNVRPPNVRPPDVRPPDVRPPNVRPPNVRPPNVRPPDVRPGDYGNYGDYTDQQGTNSDNYGTNSDNYGTSSEIYNY